MVVADGWLLACAVQRRRYTAQLNVISLTTLHTLALTLPGTQLLPSTGGRVVLLLGHRASRVLPGRSFSRVVDKEHPAVLVPLAGPVRRKRPLINQLGGPDCGLGLPLLLSGWLPLLLPLLLGHPLLFLLPLQLHREREICIVPAAAAAAAAALCRRCHSQHFALQQAELVGRRLPRLPVGLCGPAVVRPSKPTSRSTSQSLHPAMWTRCFSPPSQQVCVKSASSVTARALTAPRHDRGGCRSPGQ